MRFWKTIISVLLALCLSPKLILVASASEADKPDEDNQSSYADFCDDYYSSHELYTVYDKNGVDISTYYYSKTYDWYANGEIETIYEYMKENVSRYRKIEITSSVNTRGAIQSAKQTETFFAFVDNKKMSGFDIVYTLTGEFTYNVNTGKVGTYSNPKISLTNVGISNLVSGQMTNASTSAEKTSDGYGVIFSGEFDVVSTLYFPVGMSSIPVLNETTGPYTATFIGYGA